MNFLEYFISGNSFDFAGFDLTNPSFSSFAILVTTSPYFDYLINTQRNINNVTPLQDENYEKALYEVKQFLDNMFSWYIK